MMHACTGPLLCTCSMHEAYLSATSVDMLFLLCHSLYALGIMLARGLTDFGSKSCKCLAAGCIVGHLKTAVLLLTSGHICILACATIFRYYEYVSASQCSHQSLLLECIPETCYALWKAIFTRDICDMLPNPSHTRRRFAHYLPWKADSVA